MVSLKMSHEQYNNIYLYTCILIIFQFINCNQCFHNLYSVSIYIYFQSVNKNWLKSSQITQTLYTPMTKGLVKGWCLFAYFTLLKLQYTPTANCRIDTQCYKSQICLMLFNISFCLNKLHPMVFYIPDLTWH